MRPYRKKQKHMQSTIMTLTKNQQPMLSNSWKTKDLIVARSFYQACTMAQWSALLPDSDKALVRITAGFFPCWVCVFSLCMAGFFSGHSGFLPPSKDMPHSVHGCTRDCVCVWFCDRSANCSGCTQPSLNSSWVGSSDPMTLKAI